MAAIAALIEIRERSKQVEKTVGGAAEGSNSVRDVRGTFAMDLLDEHGRLTEAYGRLRLKLLDLSKKNRMLNYSLGSRSKRHLQIVDEVIDETYRKLVKEEVSLRIDALEEPEDTPSRHGAAFDRFILPDRGGPGARRRRHRYERVVRPNARIDRSGRLDVPRDRHRK